MHGAIKSRLLSYLLVFLAAGAVLPAFAVAAPLGEGLQPSEIPTSVQMELRVVEDVELDEGECWIGTFTAPADDIYVFYSDGDFDTYGELYADEGLGSLIAEDDDSGVGSDFSIRWTLSEGQTVFLKARQYNNGAASFSVSVKEFDPKDLSYGALVLQCDTYAFTGSPVEIDAVVTDASGDVLIENVDYTLIFFDALTGVTIERPHAPGMYCVFAVGVEGGGYNGATSSSEFEIYDTQDLANATLTLEQDHFAATGSAPELVVTVTDRDDAILGEGDYVLEYLDCETGELLDEAPSDPGDYSIRATASEQGGYGGSTDWVWYLIFSADDLSAGSINLEETEYEPTGEPVVLDITVCDGAGNVLDEGNDYVLEFADVDGEVIDAVPFKPGEYNVRAISREEGFYTGETSWRWFKILHYPDGSIANGLWGSCPWEISADGVLTVHPGNGADQPEADGEGASFWAGYETDIISAVFEKEDGEMVIAPRNMSWLFAGFSAMTSANLNGLDTSGTEDMEGMFYGCSSLETVLVRSGWTTDAVTASDGMFEGCTSIIGGDGTVYNASHVDAEYARIDERVAPGYFTTGVISIVTALVEPIAEQTYTGEAFEPQTVVTLNGVELVEDVDYAVEYKNNTNAGTATVIITGTGDYMGERRVSFTIARARISDATVLDIADEVYTGSPLTPVPSVSLNGTDLVPETDFTVSYSNNTDAGTATVIISGRGNYAGEKRVSFKILSAPIDSSGISVGPIATQTYTGSAHTPSVTVMDGSRTLRVGTDYTVSFSRNVDAGTATVTIRGKGNYTGSRTAFFEIAKAVAAAPSAKTGLVYNGSAQTGVSSGVGFTLSGTVSATSAGTYRATATLDANHVWSGGSTASRTVTWSIAAKPISANSITVASIAGQVYTGSALTPSVTVKDGSKTLKSGVDYTVSYRSNMLPGTATATIVGKGNYSGTRTATFTIAEPFADVSVATAHYEDILWLYAEGISTGFVNGSGTRTFQPYANVARCDMAAFLYRLAGSPSYTPTAVVRSYFSDVDSSTPHAKEIWWLASKGISTGWTESDGTHTFRPYSSVARADMAAFLYRLAGSPSYTPTSAQRRYFSDVSSSAPHAREIWWLAAQGVSRGWDGAGGTHSFRPYSSVARADMAAFLRRMADKGLVADTDTIRHALPA